MKKDLVIALLSILLVAAVAFVLSGVSRDLPLSPSAPFQPKAGATNVRKLAPDEKVVMRVNGERITDREVNLLIQSAPADAKAFYSTAQGRQALGDELVRMKALEQEARRMGVTEDPAVRAQIELMSAQIAAGRALEKLVEKSAEGRIRAAYEAEKTKYLALRHIAIAYQGGQIPPRDPNAMLSADQAMAKAQSVLRQVRGGVDFAATAAAVSDDMQSAQNGGMLGPARPESLPPDIAGVVGKLKQGQVSEPVRTPFAVHIFKVDLPALDDLRPMLLRQVREQVMSEEMDRLQKEAKVERDPVYFPEQKTTGTPQKPLQ